MFSVCKILFTIRNRQKHIYLYYLNLKVIIKHNIEFYIICNAHPSYYFGSKSEFSKLLSGSTWKNAATQD